HLGSLKTLTFLRQEVWWKEMSRDVKDFISSCHVCRTSKDENQKPLGLLKTLPVPTRPWQVIGINFVGPLPKSITQHAWYDRICTVIDHFTSMVHLIPARTTYKAPDVAEMLFATVYKLHSLPEAVVSDRDVLFTSAFWRRLNELTGIELRMSMAYHPQTDRTTERANHTLGQMIRQCISEDQKDWAGKLPAIEFAMNCATSATTGFSPFFLNTSQNPRMLTSVGSTKYPGVYKFVETMRETLLTAHDAIIGARVKQTTEANKHRRESTFREGQLVYLSTKNLRLARTKSRKLVPRYIGPYKILKEVTPGASYTLELPPELKKRCLHPTFHASLLR
ncbi:ribonuclease H-like protein, partial [Auricularia subglabra TFB-10046 SS5]